MRGAWQQEEVKSEKGKSSAGERVRPEATIKRLYGKGARGERSWNNSDLLPLRNSKTVSHLISHSDLSSRVREIQRSAGCELMR